MDWNNHIERSNFVLELLIMADATGVDDMMDKLFEVLVNDGEEILSLNESPKEDVNNALDQIIKWFADNERYEECHELKKIKDKCLK